MDSDETKAEAKLVEMLIDTLGYCDEDTYELISQVAKKKLKSLQNLKPKKLAYIEAYLPNSALSSDELDTWFNAKMKQSSDAGVPEAQYQHACRLWERGDHTAAVDLYKASADQGYPKSQYCYGLGLRDGVGISQDKTKGLFYIELAAGRLYSYALEYLIVLYRDNQSVEGGEKFKLYSKMLTWSQSKS